jgi:hypothetical protein
LLIVVRKPNYHATDIIRLGTRTSVGLTAGAETKTVI